MGSQITIIDYTEQRNSIYVNLEVYDAQQNRIFIAEVRFLGDMLYGDLLHSKRSSLTNICRLETIEYLKNYFSR